MIRRYVHARADRGIRGCHGGRAPLGVVQSVCPANGGPDPEHGNSGGCRCREEIEEHSVTAKTTIGAVARARGGITEGVPPAGPRPGQDATDGSRVQLLR